MGLSSITSNFRNFYRFFIEPEKCWKWLRKSDVLIYDEAGAEILQQYLAGYRAEIIHVRGESIVMPILLLAIFRLIFWKGKPIQAYVDAYIRVVSPKVIITFIDNTPAFYTISNRFSAVKTIFFQNGSRSEVADVFGHLRKDAQYHVDYMLVHGDAIGKHYNKYISGEVITAGSLKNNAVPVISNSEAGTVLFISEYYEHDNKKEPFVVGPDGTVIEHEQFYLVEKQVLDFLGKWCCENKKILRICGRSATGNMSEKSFYSRYLNGCNWQYISRSDSYSSYQLVDKAEIVVFIDSTLGYEAIGRGKKTAGFSCRGTFINSTAANFGWPIHLADNGPFWTNDCDVHEFRRVMDYLNTVGDEEWEQTRKHYASDLMVLDPGNTRFTALIDHLLSKTEKS